MALFGPKWRYAGADWAPYDFESDGVKLEVKQSAAVQSWEHPAGNGSFGIAASKGYYVGATYIEDARRHADIYVFAWHGVADQSADHRMVDQWQYYVCTTDKLPDQLTITRSRLASLDGIEATDAAGLRACVEAAAEAVRSGQSKVSGRSYFGPWRTDRIVCQCGWTGTGATARRNVEESQHFQQLDCPQCDSMLRRIDYPLREDVYLAAQEGSAEAAAQVVSIAQGLEYALAVERGKTRSSRNLPDIGPGPIDLVWKVTAPPSEDAWLIVTTGDVELIRERISFESLEPVHRLLPLLQERYGARLTSCNFEGALGYLAGDDFAAGHELLRIQREFAHVSENEPTDEQ